MGVIKGLVLFAVTLVYVSNASVRRKHMHCPWNGYEFGTPYNLRKTAEGYSWVREKYILRTKI